MIKQEYTFVISNMADKEAIIDLDRQMNIRTMDYE